ncbi:hypothetical protein AY488_08805 [Corynebacterium belfantii]|nr:hypothetical protein AY488_08805 [Corynebacterium belfantii]
MLVVIVIFSPSWDDGHVFDRANHLFFLPVANNVVLFVVVFSQLVGLVLAGGFGLGSGFFMEAF